MLIAGCCFARSKAIPSSADIQVCLLACAFMGCASGSISALPRNSSDAGASSLTDHVDTAPTPAVDGSVGGPATSDVSAPVTQTPGMDASAYSHRPPAAPFAPRHL